MKYIKLFEYIEDFWVGDYVISKNEEVKELQGVCKIVDMMNNIAAIRNLKTGYNANRGIGRLRKATDYEVEAEKYNL